MSLIFTLLSPSLVACCLYRLLDERSRVPGGR